MNFDINRHHRRIVTSAVIASVTFSAMVSLPTASKAAQLLWGTSCGSLVTWNDSAATMHLQSDVWADPDSLLGTVNAITMWNDGSANFDYSWGFGDPNSSINNGANEIAWTNNEIVLMDAPAIAYLIITPGCHIAECDVYMSSDVLWTDIGDTKAQLTAYGGPRRPLETTMVHELGHCLGLAHTADEYNIMGQSWTHLVANGDDWTTGPGEDASSGATWLYGTDYLPGLNFDVGVTHWHHSGQHGEYSTHDRNRIYHSATDTELENMGSSKNPYYTLHPWNTYELEVTYENNGHWAVTPDIAFYLSTNSTITTEDTLLRKKEGEVTLTADDVYEARHWVYIPDSIPEGDYWIGVIIDPDNELPEEREDNNATYIAKVNIDHHNAVQDLDIDLTDTSLHPDAEASLPCIDLHVERCRALVFAGERLWNEDIRSVHAAIAIDGTTELDVRDLKDAWTAYYWDGQQWAPQTYTSTGYKDTYWDRDLSTVIVDAVEKDGFNHYTFGTADGYSPLLRFEIEHPEPMALELLIEPSELRRRGGRPVRWKRKGARLDF